MHFCQLVAIRYVFCVSYFKDQAHKNVVLRLEAENETTHEKTFEGTFNKEI